MGEKGENRLKKFNRLLMWPTLVLFIFLVISGYGISNPTLVNELTGGLFTRAFSFQLHMTLVLPTLTLLTIHVLIAIRASLIRWGIREGKLLDAFLILLGAFALTLIALMQYLIM